MHHSTDTPHPLCLQVVLSHTPFRQLAAKFAHEPVLVAGRGQVRPKASWDNLLWAAGSEQYCCSPSVLQLSRQLCRVVDKAWCSAL